jgi:hypothetical protein
MKPNLVYYNMVTNHPSSLLQFVCCTPLHHHHIHHHLRHTVHFLSEHDSNIRTEVFVVIATHSALGAGRAIGGSVGSSSSSRGGSSSNNSSNNRSNNINCSSSSE